jgi:hypothetical protein
MTGCFAVTFVTGIILAAALEFDRNNIQLRMIVFATGLIVYWFSFDHDAIIAKKIQRKPHAILPVSKRLRNDLL